MVKIATQQERRSVSRLQFCYDCGQPFQPDEKPTRDHVPPEAIFATRDRDPLILAAHAACNAKHSLTDEKMGQLIALRRSQIPSSARAKKLKFLINPKITVGAVLDVDIHGQVWRWIRGFHAALYHQPFPHEFKSALQTPFVAVATGDTLRPQHQTFVRMIKTARVSRRIDRIHCNNGQLRYECVWDVGADKMWNCVFALDVCDWKDLGKTLGLPARGCAGCYTMPIPPPTATRWQSTGIVIPNFDKLDAFAP
jgi:hypothetical protein